MRKYWRSRWNGKHVHFKNALLRTGGILCIAAWILLSATALFAQGGPPLITDDPGTPENGHWENNFALTLDNTPASQSYETPIADINYGLGGHEQLKIELPWLVEGPPILPRKPASVTYSSE